MFHKERDLSSQWYKTDSAEVENCWLLVSHPFINSFLLNSLFLNFNKHKFELRLSNTTTVTYAFSLLVAKLPNYRCKL